MDRSLRAFSFASLAMLSACVSTERQFPNLDSATPGIFLDSIVPGGAELGEPPRPVSPSGLALTKVSEGYRRDLYNDAAKYCSIGYGHLVKKRPCDGTEPPEWLAGLAEPGAAALLTTDMMFAQLAVSRLVDVQITDSQYAALCDFVYNVGGTNFESSTLRAKINSGQFDQVPAQMRRWVLANGKVYEGLRVRREAEIALFFTGLPNPAAMLREPEVEAEIDIRIGER